MSLISSAATRIRLMVPGLEPPLAAEVYLGVRQAIRAEPRIILARGATRLAALDRLEGLNLAELAQRDPDNGLYAYLEILRHLRRQGGLTPAAAGPADQVLPRLLRRTAGGPPARLYLARQRELAERAFRRAGVSDRRAAFEADRVRLILGELQERHRPVIRELADRLLALGDTWRQAGRDEEALAAHTAVVRLLTDLVADSPTPGVALLAAERLPQALEALAIDLATDRSGLAASPTAERAELARRCRDAADAAQAFSQSWRDARPSDRSNLIPNTGGVVLAASAHDRAVRFLVGAVTLSVIVVTLWLLWVFWLLLTLILAPSGGDQLVWRRGRRGMLQVVMIICVPALKAWLFLRSTDADLVWLISLPSLRGLVAWPMVPIAMTGLATWAGVRWAKRPDQPALPGRVVAVVAILFVVTIVIGRGLGRPVPAPWQPPEAIEEFRRLGPALAVGLGVLIVAWMAAGALHRRRAGWPRGLWSRANLHVVSLALLVNSIFCAAALLACQHADRVQAEAYVEAAADPLSDRLGPTWREEHFGEARATLKTLQSY